MNTNRVAFFDIDGTLTSQRTWQGYLDYFKQRKIKRGTHLAFLAVHYPLYFMRRIGLISETAFRRPWASHLAWYVSGMSLGETKAVWDYSVKALENSWQPESRRAMEGHLRAGDLVMLVSSGPYPMVERIAAELQVEHFIGTRLEVRDGVFTGRSVEPIVIDENKVSTALAYLKEKQLDFDPPHSFAYADSTTDLPLLELVGNPVAAYPDESLRVIAAGRGWKIIP